MSTFVKKNPTFFLSKFAAIYGLSRLRQTWRNVNLHKNQHARGGRAETPGASNNRRRREQQSQEDRKARLDRQRLQTNHLTPGQGWVIIDERRRNIPQVHMDLLRWSPVPSSTVFQQGTSFLEFHHWLEHRNQNQKFLPGKKYTDIQ